MTCARNPLVIDNQQLSSRFLLGTALYPSLDVLSSAIDVAQPDIVTIALRRQSKDTNNAFWQHIQNTSLRLLPNTAGCHSAKEAITTACMARELFATNWIKLEVIGDDYTQQPDPFALVEAAQELCAQGFFVFPYTTDDLVLCERLLEVGCPLLMPWAAPIGSGQGVLNAFSLASLRARFVDTVMIIDAGIGRPSDATIVMEMGFDAVLANSAVALAQDPVMMANAFRYAIDAGHLAHQAGIMPRRNFASPSTPTVGTPFWHKL